VPILIKIAWTSLDKRGHGAGEVIRSHRERALIQFSDFAIRITYCVIAGRRESREPEMTAPQFADCATQMTGFIESVR
jgi:hypothetical protein